MNESGPITRPIKTCLYSDDISEVKEISRGVYRATIKGKYYLLKSAKSDSGADYQLLKREYEISKDLCHPNIATVMDFLTESPVGPAIMMEYVEGATLCDFLKGKVSDTTREKLLNQIFDAVEYIHKKGLLHNDIKAANILVTDLGADVKIIDFGFAEDCSDYLNRKLGGTAGASAPEVLSGNAASPSRAASDIYALGGIISLIYYHKYRGVVKKCHETIPERRFRDVHSLRMAIRRSRFMPWIIIVCSVLFLLSTLMVSEVMSVRESKKKQEMFEAEIKAVQHDMGIFYCSTQDTLNNKTIVPYQEFANPVIQHFVGKFTEYKASIQDPELKSVCDTVYARLLSALNETLARIPGLSQSRELGLISEEEEMFYLDLSNHDRPFVSFRK